MLCTVSCHSVVFEADLKKMLVCCTPTYPPKLGLPKWFLDILEIFFFLKSLQQTGFYSLQSFYLKTLFSVAGKVLKYYIFMDSILDHTLSTVKEKLHLIKKTNKSWPIYLPILELMGRSTTAAKMVKWTPQQSWTPFFKIPGSARLASMKACLPWLIRTCFLVPMKYFR